MAIVIPAYNEESTIAALLDHLAAVAPDELVVVDGHSADRTAARARERGARVIELDAPSRARQMNAGAAAVTSDVLLFLHADVRLERGAFAAMKNAMRDPSLLGGNFDIRYPGAPLFTLVNRWRRGFGIFYGDSGIFCRREIFQRCGGFPPWPIMEDYEFARRLWRASGRGRRLALLDAPIEVSDRRWRGDGVLSTMASWVLIQSLYTLGVAPERLARLYQSVR